MIGFLLSCVVFGFLLGATVGPLLGVPTFGPAWFVIIILGNFAFVVLTLRLWSKHG